MIHKNQILVFVVSFLIAAFFVLSIPKAGFSGTAPGGPPCCQVGLVCSGIFPSEQVCNDVGGTFFANSVCVGEPDGEGSCEPVEPIPTLNQWGMIIMAGVLGLFAVIGIFAMRRRSVGTS